MRPVLAGLADWPVDRLEAQKETADLVGMGRSMEAVAGRAPELQLLGTMVSPAILVPLVLVEPLLLVVGVVALAKLVEAQA